MRTRVAAALPTASPTAADSTPPPAAVTMAPFRVQASPLLSNRRPEGPVPYLKRFTLTTGGSVAKDVGSRVTTDLKIQWDGQKSWSFLSISF